MVTTGSAHDTFTSIGFKQRKLGAGDKEFGYTIERYRLLSIASCVVIVGTFVTALFLWSQFEVHFEKRIYNQRLRHSQHHSEVKLASVEMALWSHFHDDIHESQQAKALLKSLETSYQNLEKTLFDTVLNSTSDKASLAKEIVSVLTQNKKSNMLHVKGLMDHLIASGARSANLTKTIDKAVKAETLAEAELIKEDVKDDDLTLEEMRSRVNDEKELRGTVEQFFNYFDLYMKEFGGAHKLFKGVGEKDERFKKVEEVWDNVQGDADDLAVQQDVMDAMEDLHLAGVPKYDPTSLLTPNFGDYVEAVGFLPKIDVDDLRQLQKEFKDQTTPLISLVGQMLNREEEGLVPGLWVEHAVEYREKA
eukprot:TRINITY_DN21457_c0_g1_i2.p1 TRINITY_DN21457_c0_g1~~TRINITY_DN21457_c0_g1_i2.p1  ORF type:complete len:363 (+),score=91.59 TRINITY_DN21457_c0_g1_i2:42-1130(+)